MKKQILTEEIYRMRKLMNFDSKEFNENTTSEDMLIEENFINEQKRTKGWKFALKFWPGSKGFGSGGFYFKPRWSKKINVFDWHIQTKKGGEVEVEKEEDVSEYKTQIKTDPIDENVTGWKEFLKNNDGKMVSLMDSESQSNWEELKEDPKFIAYAVLSLEQFQNTYKKYKWKNVLVDKEVTIEKKIEILEIEEAAKEDDVKEDNAIELGETFPLDGPSNNFFDDNKWEVTDDFKNKLKEEVIDPIKSLGLEMREMEGQPKFFLLSLNIDTSCSRFRNTGDAKDMSFMQLSEARNNAAKEYIVEQLKLVGCLVDSDSIITQDAMGENGDGSSGPNPPKGNWVPTDGKQNTSLKPGSEEAEEGRDEHGDPESDKSKYRQYKYCTAEISVAANTNLLDEDEDEDGGNGDPDVNTIEIDVPVKDYLVKFWSPSKGFNVKLAFKLPRLLKWSKKIKKGKTIKILRTIKCPKW